MIPMTRRNFYRLCSPDTRDDDYTEECDESLFAEIKVLLTRGRNNQDPIVRNKSYAGPAIVRNLSRSIRP